MTTTAASRATPYFGAAILGMVAGLRSQLPFALLAYAARPGRNPRFAANAGRPLGLLRGRAALPLCGLSAIGETIVDKLPFVPSRINPGALGGRVVFGALAGAALCRDAGRSSIAGALLGGLGAAGGSYGGYYGRSALGKATGLPDPLVAVGEDALAASLGVLALRRYLSS